MMLAPGEPGAASWARLGEEIVEVPAAASADLCLYVRLDPSPSPCTVLYCTVLNSYIHTVLQVILLQRPANGQVQSGCARVVYLTPLCTGGVPKTVVHGWCT